jgi:hypothetical protein
VLKTPATPITRRTTSHVLSTSACLSAGGTKNIMDVLHNALRLGEINRDLTPIFPLSTFHNSGNSSRVLARKSGQKA